MATKDFKVKHGIVANSVIESTSGGFKFPDGTTLASGANIILGAGNLTTAGSIPYVSASGILSQDAGQLHWDATNNRLGIGTNTPTNQTHIYSSTAGSVEILKLENYGVDSEPILVLKRTNNIYNDNTGGSIVVQEGRLDGNTVATLGQIRIAQNDNYAQSSKSDFILSVNNGSGLIERIRVKGGTGSLLIGTSSDGNFRLDVAKSGSSGTARFYDQTATTGKTSLVLRAGAGQLGTDPILTFQRSDGTDNFYIIDDGVRINLLTSNSSNRYVRFGNDRVGLEFPPAGQNSGSLSVGSQFLFRFHSGDGVTGSYDVSISRASAGVLQVGDGGSNANGSIQAANYLITTASSSQASGLAVQRVFSKSVAAGELYKLCEYEDTEGDVAIEIQVSSETAGHSGTSTYRFQGGYNQLSGSYYRLYPFNDGAGHGDGADTGLTNNAWNLFIYGTSVSSSNYRYGVAVHVPAGRAGKNLIVTVTELKRGMTFTDQSSSAVITTFTNSGNIYSHKNLIPERLYLSAGSTASPSLTFFDETNTGLYRAASNDIRFTVGNEDIFRITKVLTRSYKTFYAPGLQFDGGQLYVGSTSTGITNFYGGSVAHLINLYNVDTLGAKITSIGLSYLNGGNFVVGGTSDGNFRIDVASSGSSGTARFYDQTATTGVTKVQLRAGAGQSSNYVLDVLNNSGNSVATINSSGFVSDGIYGHGILLNGGGGPQILSNSVRNVHFVPQGIRVVSGSGLYWNSVAFESATILDTGIARNAAGVVEINNGNTGVYRDLQLRAINPTSGNVGIGNTAPTHTLRVEGTFSASGNANVGNIGATNAVITGNMSLGNLIAGNLTLGSDALTSAHHTITIDPSTSGVGGNVIVQGNLQVTGTTTTVNSTTVEVTDLNITLAKDAVNAAAANGAGLTVAGASATMTYASTGDKWTFNKPLDVTGSLTASTTLSVTGNANVGNIGSNNAVFTGTLSVTGNSTQGNITTGNVITYGQFGTPIKLRVLSDNSLSFDGSSGQLFSITDTLTGDIFSVNDITGLPSIRVDSNATVYLAEISGNVGIGNVAPAHKLSVTGTMNVSGNANVGNLGATAGVFSGNITAGNINSVSGILSVTGNANVGNIGATRGVFTNIVGTLETAAQTNITSVGTLSSLTVSGNATFDTNTLFVDSVNNRVGIGTTSPATTLEISGTNAIARITGTSSSIPQLQLSSAGVVNWSLRSNQSGSSEFTIFQDSTERVRINSSGNVGIATTNPAYALHVQPVTANTSGVNNIFRVGTESTTPGCTSRISMFVSSDPVNDTNGGKIFIDAIRTANMDLAISLNDVAGAAPVERFRISGSGNVGIGNASPTHTLRVEGTVSATGNANVGNLGTAGLITATGNVSGGNLTTSGLLSVTGNANVGNIGATNANLTALTVTGNASIGNISSTSATFTSNIANVTTYNLSVNNSNNSSTPGSGIGFYTISGFAGEISTVYANGHSLFKIRTPDSWNSGNIRERYQIYSTGGGGANIFQSWFRGDGTESLRLTHGGNFVVGGTTDGNFRLDVASSGSSGTARFYDQTATNGSTTVQIRAGEGQSTTSLFSLLANNGNNLVQIYSNSGYGTLSFYNSANTLLATVANKAGTTLNFYTQYAGVYQFTGGQSAQHSTIWLETSEGKLSGIRQWDVAHANGRLFELVSGPGVPIRISPADAEAVRITTSGNVGIGNTAPTHTLRVEGTFSASGNANVGNIGATNAVITGNMSLGNLIAGNLTLGSDALTSSNSTITIDPSTAGTGGNVIIQGNLQVTGTTTTINSTTMDVADLNITVAKGAANPAAANGAGLTIDGAAATLTYNSTSNIWVFDRALSVSGNANVSNIGATNSVITANGTFGNINSVSGILSVTGNANVGNIGATRGVFTNVVGTLETASQPNITTVGTLGTLSVTGNANVGNIGATRGVFTNISGTIESGSASQTNITAVGTLGSLTVSGNAFLSTSSGNVGVGTSTPAYKLEVNGSFAATTKSFVIDHPTKSGMKLRYGSLEGPENGVYVRGRSSSHVIDLPEYWSKLVDPASITVNITPIGQRQSISVAQYNNQQVILSGVEGEYFYTVNAERIDVEKLTVEFEA